MKARFGLSHLLLGIIGVALLLLLVRYSFRSLPIASALMAMGGTLVLLVVANLIVFCLLTAAGHFFSPDLEESVSVPANSGDSPASDATVVA